MTEGANIFGRSEKFVGGFAPLHIADHLALLSITTGSSRGKILQKALEARLRELPPTDALIRQLATETLQGWDEKKGKNNFADFALKVRVALERKKLRLNLIDQVLLEMEKLRREKNENADQK